MSSIPMTPVAGYRQLSAESVALMNKNKLIEELSLRQVDVHVRKGSEEYDQRFVALARTYIQFGFMALNRAVAQPQRIVPMSESIEAFEESVEDLIAELLRQ